MIDKRRIDALLKPASWLLVAAASAFLVVVARRHWNEIARITLGPEQWSAIAALALAYGLSLLLLAAAWHAILKAARARPLAPAHSMRIHASAQLAKYVPGNVFHLVGRHILHRAAGMDDRRLAAAALVEVLLMLAAALLVATACLAIEPPPGSEQWRWLLLPVGFAAALVGLGIARKLARGEIAPFAIAFALHLAFFTMMGAVLAAILAILGQPWSLSVAGGGIAAWIAGFVTPGAPGGLGVREAVMVLAGGHVARPDVLIVGAGLFRLVTFGGDLVCFAAGWLLFRRQVIPPASKSP